jgi:hypothetical protein
MIAQALSQLRTAVKPYRLFTSTIFYQYRFLQIFVVIANCVVLYHGTRNGWWSGEPASIAGRLADIALVNFSIGILIRQQYLINALFSVAISIPTSWPLWIRWTAGKIYHFGGIHSGCNIGGSLSFLGFAVSAYWGFRNETMAVSPITVWSAAALTFLLAAIVLTAIGPLRARRHDLFERMHRFGGWSALALFWLQSWSFANDMGREFTRTSAFWALCLITFSIALPWLRLKKVPVNVERPSGHAAILSLNYGENAFPGSSNSISLNPLMEWHSFATVPRPDCKGHRLVISRAGDWTGSFIDNPPSHVWVKGIITSGVARIEVLFKRVVYVATGSGIGPVLPHLFARQVPIHLIWATREPRKTYGEKLVREIVDACPEAMIWDTDKNGKPDLAELAISAARSFDAEAVICISNRKLTWHVVGAVEREGIPGFGAIWDS